MVLPMKKLLLLSLGLAFCLSTNIHAADVATYDVVIYGGNSAGAAAAIQTARMGKSVVLIEPGQHIGGGTRGGGGGTEHRTQQGGGGDPPGIF